MAALTLQRRYKTDVVLSEWGGVCPTIRASDYKDAIKIMEVKQLGYIENGTGKHQSNTVYSTDGIIPAITTIQGGGTQQIKIMEEPKVKVIGQMDNTTDNTLESANRIYDTAGIAPCLNTCGGGGLEPKIIAMRGRNPDNPNDRTPGIELEQRAEIQKDNISNTLSTVQKDNMVLEYKAIDEQNMYIREDTIGTIQTNGSSPKHNNRILIKQATKKGYIECEEGGIADLSFPDSKLRRGRVQEGGRVSPALTCGGIAGLTRIESVYRIRKLTPKECWRLMSFTDEEYDRAKSVNSNSQLYKQAGNSIVVDVLIDLFTEVVNAIGTQKDHSGEQISIFDLFE